MHTIKQQTFCGREFTGEEISLIQEVVGACGGISRRELAHTVCELLEWKRPNHYLGYAMPYGARVQYLVYVNRPHRDVVGCVQFSSPAWRMRARDEWIGWTEARRKVALQQVVNNSRFLVLARIQNLASMLLSCTFREHFRGDWERQYGLKPLLIETVFGTVSTSRAGYGNEGVASLYPLDAQLNIPPERYSLELRCRVRKEKRQAHGNSSRCLHHRYF